MLRLERKEKYRAKCQGLYLSLLANDEPDFQWAWVQAIANEERGQGGEKLGIKETEEKNRGGDDVRKQGARPPLN